MFTIDYNREFLSNKISDELLLHDIWDFKDIEKKIINDIKEFFGFDVGVSRNINTLSGGQRSISYLVTLAYIKNHKNISKLDVKLNNILESLSTNSREKSISYLLSRGIYVS